MHANVSLCLAWFTFGVRRNELSCAKFKLPVYEGIVFGCPLCGVRSATGLEWRFRVRYIGKRFLHDWKSRTECHEGEKCLDSGCWVMRRSFARYSTETAGTEFCTRLCRKVSRILILYWCLSILRRGWSLLLSNFVPWQKRLLEEDKGKILLDGMCKTCQ